MVAVVEVVVDIAVGGGLHCPLDDGWLKGEVSREGIPAEEWVPWVSG